MKVYLLLGALSLSSLFFGCSQDKTNTEEVLSNNQKTRALVNKSIDKHGGWAAFDSLSRLTYKKRILLYDALGNLESDVTQEHTYHLRPNLSGTISWKSAGDTIEVSYEDQKAIKRVNKVDEPNSEEWARSTFMSGYYVTFQPIELMDNPNQLFYAGKDTLQAGSLVEVVQPIDSKMNADVWWYYFDQIDNLLLANMVKHDIRYSYIENLEYDSSTGLTFNAHRKSYFADSLRNKKYLRAEYFYTDYEAYFKQ